MSEEDKTQGSQTSERQIIAELVEALDAQEMADADPEASERKGYFERARGMRRIVLEKHRSGAF